MRKLAGIQGSHLARNDGRKEVQEQGLIKRARLSQWLAPANLGVGVDPSQIELWTHEITAGCPSVCHCELYRRRVSKPHLLKRQTIRHALDQRPLPNWLMFDTRDLRQKTATMAAKLREIAFWYYLAPFAHRDSKIKSAFRNGAIGVHEFEARGTTRCSQGVPFMGIAMAEMRSPSSSR
jgi:hypothetical protein